MSCFGEFLVKGSEGGVKKAVHFWCTAFFEKAVDFTRDGI